VTSQKHAEAVLFPREPVLELRGSAHVEALEGLPARTRLEDPALEVEGVAPDPVRIESHEPVPCGDDDIVAEKATHPVERVAQGLSSVCRVVLGPQQVDQRVPRLESSRARQGQIAEQGDVPGLRDPG